MLVTEVRRGRVDVTFPHFSITGAIEKIEIELRAALTDEERQQSAARG
jgi:hypothetical protein